jgi:hypothetical protein
VEILGGIFGETEHILVLWGVDEKEISLLMSILSTLFKKQRRKYGLK